MTQRDTSDSNISRKHRASASLVDDEVEESGNCEDRVEKDGAVNDTSDFMPVTRESEMKEDGERASSLSTSGSIQVSTVDAFQVRAHLTHCLIAPFSRFHRTSRFRSRVPSVILSSFRSPEHRVWGFSNLRVD